MKVVYSLLGILAFGASLSLLPTDLVVTTVYSQTQFCSREGICAAFNIPSVSVSSGHPDLLITLQAPSSEKWFAIGFGSEMAGSLMLVAWPYNQEVIVSSRLAQGHSLPPVYPGPQITLLSQNVTKDLTTVQLKCSDCTVWSTGSLDIQSTSANLIYAYSGTAPSNPSSPGSSFLQHDDHGNFNLNLKSAITSSNTAPVIAGQQKSTGSTGGLSERQKIIIIHGILMALIWVILFPLGAVIIRFFGNVLSNAVGKHRFVQITALLLLFTAGGVGVYLARGHQFTLFHHFFGASIIGAAVIQAFFGWYHHKRFVQDKPTNRRWFTYVHLWLGRTVILCGMANCGFGILLTGRPLRYAIIFWIVCGGLAGLYFFLYVIMAIVRRRTGKHAGVAYTPAPGPYELNPYQGSQVNLIPGQQPGSAPRYSPPVSGRYEPDRYDTEEHGYMDQPPEPYDPPRRQFDDPVQRFGSPSGQRPPTGQRQDPVQRYGSPSGQRQDLHFGP